MRFSAKVRNRANLLKATYSQLYPGTTTLHSIWFVDDAWETFSDMQKYKPDKVDKWLDIASNEEVKLRKLNILNDVDAIAYMDRVEPILKDYSIHYNLMIERHQEEIERFTEGLRF